MGHFRKTLTPVLLALGLAITVVFFVEAIANQSFAAAAHFIAALRPEVAITVSAVAAAFLLLDAVFGRSPLGAMIAAPPLLVLAWISAEKTQYLLEPLYPSDFLFTRQVFDLLPALARARVATAIAIAVVAIVALATLCLAWRQARGRFVLWSRKSRVAIGAASLIVLQIIAYGTQPEGGWLFASIKLTPRFWDQQGQYRDDGLLLALAYNFRGLMVSEPSNYRGLDPIVRSAAKTTHYRPQNPAPVKADIVIFMSEAFWDPTQLPGVKFSFDPMPTARQLAVGEIFSPTYGGGTANVELETLTGFSNAFLPPATIAYQQYIRTKTPSLVWFLRGQKYLTLAMHPYHKWFWNRQAVYPNLGFERFLGIDELGALPQSGGYVSDVALARAVAAQVDAADRPAFVYAITMQNHGPYPAGRYTSEIAVESNLPESYSTPIKTYAAGLSEADAALRELVAWATARKRPTILVFFGDHLPALGPGFGILAETSFITKPHPGQRLSPGDMQRLRQTPLVVWSNMQDVREQIGTMSPSFVPYVLLKTLGLKHPFYTDFLGQLWSNFRVIEKGLLITSDGKPIENWSVDASPVLKEYNRIQYDTMFGDRKLAPTYFDDEMGYLYVDAPAPRVKN